MFKRKRRKIKIEQPGTEHQNAWLKYALFSGALISYCTLVPWINGLLWQPEQLYFEIPLILYLYYLLNWCTKPSRLQSLNNALPLFGSYLLYDYYVYTLGEVPRLVDLNLLNEQSVISADITAVILAVPCLLPLLLILLRLRPVKLKSSLYHASPLAVLAVLLYATPGTAVWVIEAGISNPMNQSFSAMVARHGRYTTTLYYEAKRQQLKQQLTAYRNPNNLDIDSYGEFSGIKAKKNIHIVLLDNLIGHEQLKHYSFNNKPVHVLYSNLASDAPGKTVLPLSGYRHVDSEFEVLCGVPAFKAVSSVDYEAFTGAQTSCLPQLLNQLGYHTIATNSYKPDLYNSATAYQGMGFNEIFFPDKFSPQSNSYLQWKDTTEGFLFDASLLQQNSNYIEQQLERIESPVLNYVVSFNQSTSYSSDEVQRPEIITLADQVTDKLKHFFNQVFYRTHAVAEYLANILSIDPDSLIIISGTANPSIIEKNSPSENNTEDTRVSPLIVYNNGELVRYNGIKQFEIFQLVLEYASEGRFCKTNKCSFEKNSNSQEDYIESYLKIMSLAMR